MWLFLLFVAVPILEIGLFIEVGGAIGVFPTLAIVILTALAGTWLMRVQGLSTLGRLQSSLSTGENPVDPIAHGALILVAGVLLLTPGFFTDTMGLLLLVPPLRALVIKWGAARLAARASVYVHTSRPANDRSGQTIEGDFIEIDTPEEGPPGHSGWTKPH